MADVIDVLNGVVECVWALDVGDDSEGEGAIADLVWVFVGEEGGLGLGANGAADAVAATEKEGEDMSANEAGGAGEEDERF